jgi:hypothetical protein
MGDNLMTIDEAAEKFVSHVDREIEHLEMTLENAVLSDVSRRLAAFELEIARRWHERIAALQARRAARAEVDGCATVLQ